MESKNKKTLSKKILKTVSKVKEKFSRSKTEKVVSKNIVTAPKKFPGLGINVVLKHTDQPSMLQYIECLKELRVEWVRLEFNYYGMLEDSVMDFFIEQLRKADIKILGLLTGLVPGTLVNCWIPSLNFKCPLDTLDDYKAYTERLVIKYKAEILDWEIWNEPNTLRFWIHNPDPSEYVRLVAAASPIIKKINPKNKTYFGGLMGDDLRVIAPFQCILEYN